jgi:hypothetical protein
MSPQAYRNGTARLASARQEILGLDKGAAIPYFDCTVGIPPASFRSNHMSLVSTFLVLCFHLITDGAPIVIAVWAACAFAVGVYTIASALRDRRVH